MLDPFSESLEKKEYAIEKILASLLFELFDFEFQIWTCTNSPDFLEIQYTDVF